MLYDVATFTLLIICVFRGAAKGIAWQVAGIGAMVLCFMFATPLSAVVAPKIPLEAPVNRWAAMLVIYLAFSFATFTVARGFREFLERERFQEFDRHLGAVFGLLKGGMLSLVFTFFLVGISVNAREYILKTHTGYYSAVIMNALNPVMPEELHALLEKYLPFLKKGETALEEGLATRPGGSPLKSSTTKKGLQDDWDDTPREDALQQRSKSTTPAKKGGGYQPSARDLTQTLDDPNAQNLLIDAVGKTAKKVIGKVENELDGMFRNISDGEEQAQAQPKSKQRTYPAEKAGEERVAPKAPKNRSPRDEETAGTGRRRYRYHHDQYEPLIQDVIKKVSRDTRQNQDQIRYDLETQMKGLPKSIAAAVLDDLKADLLGEGTDPDPQTDVETPISTRIKRQIDQLGMPKERMTQGMKERLDAIERD